MFRSRLFYSLFCLLAFWPWASFAAPPPTLSDRASIDCAKVDANPKASTVAKVLCSSKAGADADWDLNAVLAAIAGLNDAAAQKKFDKEQDDWRRWLNNGCFMADDKRPGQDGVPNDACIFLQFHKRAAVLRTRLSGDAWEEAMLTPEQRAQIQAALGIAATGEFGPETRLAIRAFQSGAQAPATGFLSADQRAKLLTRGNALPGAQVAQAPTQPPPPQNGSITVNLHLDYDGSHPASIEYRGLKVLVDNEAASEGDGKVPLAKVSKDLKTVTLRLKDAYGTEVPSAEIRIITLDSRAAIPQVVLTFFWQGAHCCTVTRIATTDASGEFRVIDGGILNGGGYEFQDIDNDGSFELVSVDNSFLYAFASYAQSLAPPRISKIVDGKLVDVTTADKFRDYLRQNLSRIEQSPDWNENGFLAGWVAARTQLGEFSRAWQVMLQRYDRTSTWSVICTIGVSLDKCPAKNQQTLEFPDALARHLVKNGYVSSDQAREALAAWRAKESDRPASSPSRLEVCSGAKSTVERLVGGQLIGRKLATDDHLNAVSAENNFTLDGVEEKIGKTICSVTIDVNLPALVSELAGRNDMRGAARISQLATQRGTQLTRRVRFTVQPTSDAQQSWVTIFD